MAGDAWLDPASWASASFLDTAITGCRKGRTAGCGARRHSPSLREDRPQSSPAMALECRHPPAPSGAETDAGHVSGPFP